MKVFKPEPLFLSDLLRELESVYKSDPSTLEEVTNEALSDAVKAAVRTSKKSVLTIKLSFTPKGETMIVSADVSTTIPKPEPVSSRLFVDNRGNLTTEDPKQPSISRFIENQEKEAANG